ncbi:MAG: methyltransferase regulatory domain-containing protein, partial [Solirubrobacteraceae bacterium]
CGSGSNLVSMAFRWPKSTFVGVDFVAAQIEAGRFAASEVGLRNIELQSRSIVDIGDADGLFDYIICHGVYSWVPPEVQQAILRVCDRNLAPNGVAYVSYNAYPGWHRRAMLREMMMYYDDLALDPAQRVARARAFVAALASVHAASASSHGAMLHEEAEQIAKQTDRHLYHEQLEPWNEPVYFSEFMRRASEHRLSYVAESQIVVEPTAMVDLPELLVAEDDRVRTEQYLDFVRGRTFRRTLLCHTDVRPAAQPLADALRRVWIRSTGEPVEPSAEDAARGPGVGAFRAFGGRTITTNNPLMIATLSALQETAPAAMPFDDLERRVAARLAASDPATLGDATLSEVLLLCARGGFLEFRALPS